MAGEPLRVLLIQSWLVRGAETRDALATAGYHPQIYRVDFESALSAALPRGSFDIVILDAKTSGISRATVETLMKDAGIKIPLVEVLPDRSLADDVRSALAARRN